MEEVETRTSGTHRRIGNGPPHHLLQSQVFRRVGANNLIRILPEKVTFTGFQPNQYMKKRVRVLNISSQRQRFHIIPPQTEFFKIEYKKFDGPHVPGSALPITVTLFPDSWRTYTDSIKVHCPDPEDNLIIPLHAYPCIDTSRFPRTIDFKNVKLGSRVHRSITIWSRSNMDVPYTLNLKETDSFKVIPAKDGVITAGNSIEFKIYYTPKEYCTKTTTLTLSIQSGDTTISPLICTISGNCKMKEIPDINDYMENHPDITPAIHGKPKKVRNSKIPKSQKMSHIENVKQSVYNKSAQLSQISTQHGVNRLLLNGLTSGNQFTTHIFQDVETQQFEKYKENEAGFMEQLMHNENLERSCRVKWQSRLGNPALKNVSDVKDTREKQNQTECYKLMKSDEFCHYYNGRVPIELQDEIKIKNAKSTFSVYNQDDWWRRRNVKKKFRNAALVIITRIRANNILRRLRECRETCDDVVFDFKKENSFVNPFPDKMSYSTTDPMVDKNLLHDRTMLYALTTPDHKVSTEIEHGLLTLKDRTDYIPPPTVSYSYDHRYSEFLIPDQAIHHQEFTFSTISPDLENWTESMLPALPSATSLLMTMMDRAKSQFVERAGSRASSARLRSSKSDLNMTNTS